MGEESCLEYLAEFLCQRKEKKVRVSFSRLSFQSRRRGGAGRKKKRLFSVNSSAFPRPGAETNVEIPKGEEENVFPLRPSGRMKAGVGGDKKAPDTSWANRFRGNRLRRAAERGRAILRQRRDTPPGKAAGGKRGCLLRSGRKKRRKVIRLGVLFAPTTEGEAVFARTVEGPDDLDAGRGEGESAGSVGA